MNRVFQKEYNMLLLLHPVAIATQNVRCKHIHMFSIVFLRSPCICCTSREHSQKKNVSYPQTGRERKREREREVWGETLKAECTEEEKKEVWVSLSLHSAKKKKERRIPLSSLFYRSYLRFFRSRASGFASRRKRGISFPSQLNRIYELGQARPLA